MTDALNNLVSNNVIKNITQEVMRECIKFDVTMKENQALFFINLLSLNPIHGINFDNRFERDNVERFVNYCVEIIIAKQRPFLQTMYMQITYLQNAINFDMIIENQMKLLNSKTEQLTQKIIETDGIMTKDDREKFFKKIVVDIIVNNGLGSPANPLVIKETTNALNSVMSKSDLTSFLTLNQKERLASLKDLRGVVCGIRIFNKDAGHCGEGIINLPEFLKKNYESTKTMLDITLSEINHKITILTEALLNVIEYNKSTCEIKIVFNNNDNDINDKHSNKDDNSELSSNNNNNIENFNYLKEIATMYRQQEIYVNELSTNLNDTNIIIDKYIEIYRQQLDELHATVQFKIAIPCELIFPKFVNLSKTWLQLENQIYILAEINKLNNLLIKITESLPYYETIEDDAKNLLGNIKDLSSSSSLDNKIEKADKVEYLNIKNDEFKLIKEKKKKQKLEYRGFCPKMIKGGEGFLIPGDIKYGLCEYNKKIYSFYKANYIDSYNQYPTKLINDVMQTVRYHPELIFLLNIYDELKANIVSDINTFDTEKVISMASCDCEVQTELHPIPYKFDPDYTSNIWDLRRKAIQLANIRKCMTKSAQTVTTYQRFGIKTQTNNTKNKKIQTKRESYTNVPKPATYLRYVRGVPTNANTDLMNLTPYVEDHNVCNTINCTTPIKDYFIKPYVLRPIVEKRKIKRKNNIAPRT